jgi:hypothetical protein
VFISKKKKPPVLASTIISTVPALLYPTARASATACSPIARRLAASKNGEGAFNKNRAQKTRAKNFSSKPLQSLSGCVSECCTHVPTGTASFQTNLPTPESQCGADCPQTNLNVNKKKKKRSFFFLNKEPFQQAFRRFQKTTWLPACTA